MGCGTMKKLTVQKELVSKDTTVGAASCGVVSGSSADNVARIPHTEGSSDGVISSTTVLSAVMPAVFLLRNTDAK